MGWAGNLGEGAIACRDGEWDAVALSGDELESAVALFRDVVHSVNLRDYTQAQVDAWAPRGDSARSAVVSRLSEQFVVGVRAGGLLVGFGSFDGGGIDMLYVREDYLRQGIASCILRRLEAKALAAGVDVMRADVSLTAMPFFERRGYRVVQRQVVKRRGVFLENAQMEKPLIVAR